MKGFTVTLLVVVAVAMGTVAAADVDPAKTGCDEPGPSEEDWESALKCFVYGQNFNGRQTCNAGCHLGCAQPGCGGFKECQQIPNPWEKPTTYLHKYKCICKNQ